MKQTHTHRPQRVRHINAFVKSLLSHRSAYAISTNQMRSAFARATGYAT